MGLVMFVDFGCVYWYGFGYSLQLHAAGAVWLS